MSDNDETGNPKYDEEAPVAFEAKYAPLLGRTDQGVEFIAAGPNHRVGSGWVASIHPVLTRKGDIEPVYMVRVYWMDGAEVPQDEQPRYIVLGEAEITRVFPRDTATPASDETASE